MKYLTLLILVLLAANVAAEGAWTEFLGGASTVFSGIQQMGRGLVLGGTQIISAVLSAVGVSSTVPYWFASLIEIFLALVGLRQTYMVTKSLTRYVVLFLILLFIASAIMGGVTLTF